MESINLEQNDNCTLNNQLLDNVKYYNKELIFGNFDSKIRMDQINNKLLELKQIHETEILINELSSIENVSDNSNEMSVYTIIILALTIIIIIWLCKKPICNFVKRVKSNLTMGEINNCRTKNTTIALNSTRAEQVDQRIPSDVLGNA